MLMFMGKIVELLKFIFRQRCVLNQHLRMIRIRVYTLTRFLENTIAFEISGRGRCLYRHSLKQILRWIMKTMINGRHLRKKHVWCIDGCRILEWRVSVIVFVMELNLNLWTFTHFTYHFHLTFSISPHRELGGVLRLLKHLLKHVFINW